MSGLTYRDDRTVADAEGVPLFRFYADRTTLAERLKIAAAPELYATLELVRSKVLDALTRSGGREDDCALLREIDPVLAKARGDQ